MVDIMLNLCFVKLVGFLFGWCCFDCILWNLRLLNIYIISKKTNMKVITPAIRVPTTVAVYRFDSGDVEIKVAIVGQTLSMMLLKKYLYEL